MNTILTLTEYSKRTGISEEDLKGKRGKRNVTIARFVYWYYLNQLDPIKWSRVQIAKMFDRPTHCAISNGINQIENFKDTNDPIITPYKEIILPFLQEQEQN